MNNKTKIPPHVLLEGNNLTVTTTKIYASKSMKIRAADCESMKIYLLVKPVYSVSWCNLLIISCSHINYITMSKSNVVKH